MNFKQFKLSKENFSNDIDVTFDLTQFEDIKVKKITQLGIQGYPGMTFGFNEKSASILLGSTGLLDLDLNSIPLEISFIYFPEETIKVIRNNPNLYILIDVIYERGE